MPIDWINSPLNRILWDDSSWLILQKVFHTRRYNCQSKPLSVYQFQKQWNYFFEWRKMDWDWILISVSAHSWTKKLLKKWYSEDKMSHKMCSTKLGILLIFNENIATLWWTWGAKKKHTRYSFAILKACLDWTGGVFVFEIRNNWHWLNASACCETSSANFRFEYTFSRWISYSQRGFFLPFCEAFALEQTHGFYGSE